MYVDPDFWDALYVYTEDYSWVVETADGRRSAGVRSKHGHTSRALFIETAECVTSTTQIASNV